MVRLEVTVVGALSAGGTTEDVEDFASWVDEDAVGAIDAPVHLQYICAQCRFKVAV